MYLRHKNKKFTNYQLRMKSQEDDQDDQEEALILSNLINKRRDEGSLAKEIEEKFDEEIQEKLRNVELKRLEKMNSEIKQPVFS